MSAATGSPLAPEPPRAARSRLALGRSQVAGLLACAALVAALLAGPGGAWLPAALLAMASALLFAGEGIVQVVRAFRAGRALRALGALLILGVFLFGLLWLREINPTHPRLFSIGLAVLFGGGLVIEWFVVSLERLDRGGTPWQQLTSAPAGRRDVWRRVRLAVAVLLLLWAAVWVIQGVLGLVTSIDSGGALALLALIGVIGLVASIAIIPIVALEQARTRRARQLHDRALDRQAVAAHLHDSVLQTLSLIQRTRDHDQVVTLARQQERSLRAWLAGRDESEGATLAAALRSVCAEVEREVPGTAIECVTAGDAVLDERVDAIARAVREALRNALRHAPGAEVRVFQEVEEREIVVYVRDTGPGFDLAAVPEERRGVRDAIFGRMAHAGGSATIESDGAGTEVVLRLPFEGHRTLRTGGRA